MPKGFEILILASVLWNKTKVRRCNFAHICSILTFAGEAKGRHWLFACALKVFPEHLPDVVAFLKFSLLLKRPWPLKPGPAA